MDSMVIRTWNLLLYILDIDPHKTQKRMGLSTQQTTHADYIVCCPILHVYESICLPVFGSSGCSML